MARKRTRDPEKTRARILDAAARVIVREGKAGSGVNALAAAAGVGKPLIYRYFGGPEGVLDALAAREAARAEHALSAPVPAGLPVSDEVYRMLRFARVLARAPALKALFRALLVGGLSASATRTLLGLLPAGGADGNGEKRALLLAAAAFIALAGDHVPAWAGTPLDSAKHLARLETALVGLAESRGPARN